MLPTVSGVNCSVRLWVTPELMIKLPLAVEKALFCRLTESTTKAPDPELKSGTVTELVSPITVAGKLIDALGTDNSPAMTGRPWPSRATVLAG